MIYDLPSPTQTDLKVLDLIAGLHQRLEHILSSDNRRWTGSLRRSSMARAIRGSNTIEGYNATLDQVMGAIENEPPAEYTETWLATKGYRDAMTYILQACRDPYFEYNKQFLKSLHFMMIGHEMAKSPGQWRTGTVYVVDQQTGQTVYEAPDAGLVNDLVEELVVMLRDHEKIWAPVIGAMAHLNLTMIHPFRDGNGRMARALQTLVIAKAGMTDPILSSIEEWLGENTPEYYKILAEVGKGKWSPKNDALPWIRFCLKAHYQQAQRLVRRVDEYAQVYGRIEKLTSEMKLNERTQLPLFDAAIGYKVTNMRYREEAEVTEFVASRDLKKLSELGLVNPVGEGRGRFYEAGPQLKAIRGETRRDRTLDDPYQVVEAAEAKAAATEQLSLELSGKAPSSSPKKRGEKPA